MARGLMGASLMAGFGQGVAQAAQTGMQIYGASMLQKERAELEAKRTAVLEGYASAREQRGYAHSEALAKGQQDFQRGMKQEEFGQNQLTADLAVGRAEAAAERERGRLRSPDTITAEAEAEKLRQEAGKETRLAKREEEFGWDVDKETRKAELLGSNPVYLANQAKLADAKMSAGEKADLALKQYHLAHSKEADGYQTDYVKAVQSGDPGKIASAKKAYEAFAQKPWEADRIDATNAVAIARETGTEITRLSAQKKDLMPDSPESAVLDRKINDLIPMHQAALTRAAKLSGIEQPKKAGPINIVDPFATPDGPKTMEAKTTAPPAPAKPAEKTGLAGYLADEKPRVDEYLASLKPGDNPVAANPSGEFVDAKRLELQNRVASLQGTKAPGEPPVSYQLTKEPRGLVDTASNQDESTPSVMPTNGTTSEPTPTETQRTPSATASPYEAEITAAAQKYNVRPALLREVLRQESNFDPKAVNPKSGAKGLGQFMDATAKQYGVTDRFDPNQSIEGAAKFLGDLSKKYEGNESKMLAGYNFGQGRVDRGEAYPQETTNYIKTVLGKATDAADQNAAGQSVDDILKTVPPEKREFVMNELDQAFQLFKDGKINETQFKSRVLTAWTAVPERDITKWNASANAVSTGLMGEARKGSR